MSINWSNMSFLEIVKYGDPERLRDMVISELSRHGEDEYTIKNQEKEIKELKDQLCAATKLIENIEEIIKIQGKDIDNLYLIDLILLNSNSFKR